MASPREDRRENTYRFILLVALAAISLSALMAIGVAASLLLEVQDNITRENLATAADSPAVTYSMVLTSFVITVALSSIVPYFISTTTIRSESRKVLEEEGIKVDQAIVDNRRTDAHLSRIIGWTLANLENPTWSIGWSFRAIKRYNKVLHLKPHYVELVTISYSDVVKSINVISTKANTLIKADELPATEALEIAFGLKLDNDSKRDYQASPRERVDRIERACKDAIDSLHEYESQIVDYSVFPNQGVNLNDFINSISPFLTLSISLLVCSSLTTEYTGELTSRLRRLSSVIKSRSDYPNKIDEYISRLDVDSYLSDNNSRMLSKEELDEKLVELNDNLKSVSDGLVLQIDSI